MENETARLILTLKDLLKQKNYRYQDLCDPLQLSEPSIKRLFSKMNFDIDQICKICAHINVSFYELSKLSFENWSQTHAYTPDQDRLLGENPLEAYVYVRLLVGYKPAHIKAELKLSDNQMLKILNRLDHVGILKLLPRGKVQMLIKGPFKHIENGSFEKVFFPRFLKIAFDHFFQQIKDVKNFGGLLHVREFYLTPEMFKKFKQELEEVSLKYRQINNWQIVQNNAHDLIPVTALLCLDELNSFKKNISL